MYIISSVFRKSQLIKNTVQQCQKEGGIYLWNLKRLKLYTSIDLLLISNYKVDESKYRKPPYLKMVKLQSRWR